MTDFEKQMLQNMLKNGTTAKEIAETCGYVDTDTVPQVRDDTTPELDSPLDKELDIAEIKRMLNEQGRQLSALQAKNVKESTLPVVENESMDDIIKSTFIDPILSTIQTNRRMKVV